MKKGFLFIALLGLFAMGNAQNNQAADTSLSGPLREADAFFLKGDVYKAAYGFQLVLDQALREHKTAVVLKAYDGLIRVFVKSYNYPKAFQLQTAYMALKDSLREEQGRELLKTRELAFRQQQTEVEKTQQQEKDSRVKLEQKLDQQIRRQDELFSLVYGLAGLCLLLLIALFICMLRLKRKSSSLPAPPTAVALPPQPEPPRVLPPLATVPAEPPAPALAKPLKQPEAKVEEPAVVQAEEAAGEAFHSLLKKLFSDSFLIQGKQAESYFGIEQAQGTSFLLFAASRAADVKEKTKWSAVLKTVAAGQTGSPDTLLGSFTEPASEKQAVLCFFDLKGGWLRFACEHTSIWLVRKEEIKEFGPLTHASESEKRAPGFHTLGLRKGDSIYIVFKHTGQPGNATEFLKKTLLSFSSQAMHIQEDSLRRSLSSPDAAEMEMAVLGLRI